MPKTKQRRTASQAAAVVPQPTICDKADVLFRSAAECCRQHHRYARLVEMETDESEQRAALKLVAASDEQLAAAAAAYEASCMKVNGERRDEWWHKANSLWHACREYARRHSLSDRASGEFRAHDLSKLASLGVEYELEASALLALQQAVDAYRKLRPEADWCAPTPARR
ncbi:MAG: hypothetical protein K0S86_4867 [Geminicoccaceae bacterium]|jgi:hypothetical protein|nr:hypothetical protein [Geminicoccaceae bacterium]